MSCEQCVKKSSLDNRLTLSPLEKPSEHITGPEDQQIDSVPEIFSDGFQMLQLRMCSLNTY